ncbi:mitosis protein DIM1 domain-containing protein [Ditylenchus destructor]|nr:mitosis protein DIM1 domain-containing protein [Ditylenchus destructor]
MRENVAKLTEYFPASLRESFNIAEEDRFGTAAVDFRSEQSDNGAKQSEQFAAGKKFPLDSLLPNQSRIAQLIASVFISPLNLSSSLIPAFPESQLKTQPGCRICFRNVWQVDRAILSEENRVVVIRFGHDWDPSCMRMDETLYKVANKVKNFAVVYLVDTSEVPDFSKMKWNCTIQPL